jgi:hypothetical protein
MRNELHLPWIGKPVSNKVLIEVTDTFDTLILESGIMAKNAAHDDSWSSSPGFDLTEFVILHGIVVDFPKRITKGSFDYETECELKIGDEVFWNCISTKSNIPIAHKDKKYLLVDYHEIHARRREGVLSSINGFYLFEAIPEINKFMEFTNVKREVTEKWKIAVVPEKFPIHDIDPVTKIADKVCIDIWEVGDIVYLSLGTHAYKLQGDINKVLDTQLYAAYGHMIMCEA